MESLPERQQFYPSIKYHAALKTLVHHLGKRVQAFEAVRADRCARFDLDPDESAGGVFKDNIHLLSCLGAIMKKLRPSLAPCRLFAQFHHHEVFEQWAGQYPISDQAVF